MGVIPNSTDLNNIKTPGTYTVASTPTPKPIFTSVAPWDKPKIVAMLSVFGGKVISVKNIMEPTIRRVTNETFYR